jgi:hypothetical protein
MSKYENEFPLSEDMLDEILTAFSKLSSNDNTPSEPLLNTLAKLSGHTTKTIQLHYFLLKKKLDGKEYDFQTILDRYFPEMT